MFDLFGNKTFKSLMDIGPKEVVDYSFKFKRKAKKEFA